MNDFLKKLSGHPGYLVVASCCLLFYSAAAQANSAAFISYRDEYPWFVLFVVIVAVLLEWYPLMKYAGLGRAKAFWASIYVNFCSTAVGFLLEFLSFSGDFDQIPTYTTLSIFYLKLILHFGISVGTEGLVLRFLPGKTKIYGPFRVAAWANACSYFCLLLFFTPLLLLLG